MKLPPNPLLPEQNALFDARMRYWQARLGLGDWRVERSRRKPKAMAEVVVNYEARLASYATGDFGAAPITFATIDACARHEMLHVLLAEFKHVVHMEAHASILESAEHRVVTTLEKILTPEGPAA